MAASRETASETVRLEGFEGHFEDLDGGYTVAFATFMEDLDLDPLLRGSSSEYHLPRQRRCRYPVGHDRDAGADDHGPVDR